MDALRALARIDYPSDRDMTTRSIDELIRHIVIRHHAYVRSALPTVEHYLETLERSQGTRHPELAEVKATLARFEADLHGHVHLENNVLFPKAVELERRLFERG